ncbi:PadR family transcriptional regulator [Hyalangium versicolor]|uniref:PadR family transcriptional regulator n=1 Tax=Hyalangium versicolor TaxID=2861190 RepID=UPI001CCA8F65|nr:PadR family transcriptional regulator [Hyalangium versicolor]
MHRGPFWNFFGRPGAGPFEGPGIDERAIHERMAMGGRRGHGGRGGPGGPFGFGPPFGRGGFPWDRFRPGPRARRGDVRAGILALLAEQPRNGYQIMQELEQRSQGLWRPSPGSVYPALQQLEDEGLVKVQESGGGRVFMLTDKGQTYVKEHREEVAAPWEQMNQAGAEGFLDIMNLMRSIGSAAMQVQSGGNAAQAAEARKVLVEARRALYRILAEDEGGPEGESEDEG